MVKSSKQQEPQKVDTKEFDLPETHFISNIENRVFQGIVVQCIQKTDGVSLVSSNFIDNIFGREQSGGQRSIHVTQDDKSQSVKIKVEVNIAYGLSIPQKADEIHNAIADEVVKMTGLHVDGVHVVFRNVLPADQLNRMEMIIDTAKGAAVSADIDEEAYNDDF